MATKIMITFFFTLYTSLPNCNLHYNLKKQTPLFTKYSLYTLSSNANFSNEKAKEKLKFKNRNMKDTIKDTVEWMNKK